jgi:hypothetical protein
MLFTEDNYTNHLVENGTLDGRRPAVDSLEQHLP